MKAGQLLEVHSRETERERKRKADRGTEREAVQWEELDRGKRD